MKFYCLSLIIAVLLLINQNTVLAQDSTGGVSGMLSFPPRLIDKINKKISGIDKQLTRQSEKYLDKLVKSENKLKRKIFKADSVTAKDLFSFDAVSRYKMLARKIRNDSVMRGVISGAYLPYQDSLGCLLLFANKNQQLFTSSKFNTADIDKSLNSLKRLEAKMQTADRIKQFIQQRKEQIRNYLLHTGKLPAGIVNTYHDYSKQVYYYEQQVNEYKNMLNDPGKMLRTALVLLNKIPAFRSFMQKYSMLASLFPASGTAVTNEPVQGLTARDQLNNFISSRLGDAGSGIYSASLLQKSIQSAQDQAGQLKNKLNESGGGDLDMPNPIAIGFKPNTQKTKSFFRRFEYGTNLQTMRSTYFFPVTTDLGLSMAYRLNDRNSVGIGVSYKMGWGQDIRHIAFSNQGIGLRSFLDINIKKSFFASGGFEYNYQQPFYSAAILHHPDSWQQSGLIGISKIVSLKTKLFKKTKVQVLWDFLSYQQMPAAQPFKFRVGYNF